MPPGCLGIPWGLSELEGLLLFALASWAGAGLPSVPDEPKQALHLRSVRPERDDTQHPFPSCPSDSTGEHFPAPAQNEGGPPPGDPAGGGHPRDQPPQSLLALRGS